MTAMVSDWLKRARGCSLICSLLFVMLAFEVVPGLPGAHAATLPVAGQGKARKTRIKKPAANATGPAATQKVATTAEVGRRDPFYVPVPVKPGTEGEIIEGPLPPGKRGLVVSQLTLEGIVRMETTHSMIAVVANPANRAYFLRENDEVYNGVVSKITPDSVTFTEKYRTAEGQESAREVVKRLAPAPGVIQ